MHANLLKFRRGMVAFALASFLVGCGGGGGSSSGSSNSGGSGNGNAGTGSGGSSVPTGTFTVNAVDDGILGAIISAPECASFSEQGSGVYTLKECISTPSSVNVINGFIDTNSNGVQDDNETAQVAPLKLNVSQSGLSDNFTVTPLTTLAAQDNNLLALAKALGINENELFQDSNRDIQRAVNAILISARKAGITKFDSFVQDLTTRIKDSNATGLNALNAVKTYMKNHQDTYKNKFGVVFGGFIDDTSALDLTSPTVLNDVEKKHTVPAGKIMLGGFIYDTIIPNAAVTLYDGRSSLANTSSDTNGRYFLPVNNTILDASKVYRLEAVSGNVKLISYVTTQELKNNLTGRQVSSGNLEDLIVSNVTTAKAVLVQKTNPSAENNATAMNEAKALVENLYNQDILTISGVIKDIVDNNKTLTTASDTLSLVQEIVEVNTTTKELTTTLPSEVNQTAVNTQVANIQSDPLLSTQVDSTAVVSAGSLRSIMENHTLYEFYYNDDFQPVPLSYSTIQINPDGSLNNYEYNYDENSSQWITSSNFDLNAGDILWSSDDTKLYIVAPSHIPSKIILMAKENINVLGKGVDIYHLQEEITANPKDRYYTDFVANAEHSGTVDFTSMSDSDKNIIIKYSADYSATYHLNDDGTYTTQNNLVAIHKYHTLVKDGKTFVIFDDGETNDGGGAIIYLDFNNQKAYQADYHNIGFKDSMIHYDSTAMINIWKNLPFFQQNELTNMINTAQANATHSATNTWSQITERVIYHYIKSLEGKEGLKKFLTERELYTVTNVNSASLRVDTMRFSFDFSTVNFSGTDDDGAYNDDSNITAYTEKSFTISDNGTNLVLTINEIADDYLLIDFNDGSTQRTERVYFDRDKAELYIYSQYYQNPQGEEGLKKFLAGKEVYGVTKANSTSWRIGTIAFASDFSTANFFGVDDEGAYNDISNITNYTAKSFTISDGGDSIVLTVEEVTHDYLLIGFNDGNSQHSERVYFNKAKAQTYIDTLN